MIWRIFPDRGPKKVEASMPVEVRLRHIDASGKWEIYVTGACSEEEAKQAFNAAALTLRDFRLDLHLRHKTKLRSDLDGIEIEPAVNEQNQRFLIPVPWNFLGRLARWASLMRTLNCAAGLISELSNKLDANSGEYDEAQMCMEELEQIGPAIDSVFMALRNELWAQEQRQGKRFEIYYPREKES